jgi:hypothetical protein
MGNNPRFAEVARELGHQMAQRGIELVYGGGHVGLMGVVADAVLEKGGKVTGVIPQKLVDLGRSRSGEKHIPYSRASC